MKKLIIGGLLIGSLFCMDRENDFSEADKTIHFQIIKEDEISHKDKGILSLSVPQIFNDMYRIHTLYSWLTTLEVSKNFNLSPGDWYSSYRKQITRAVSDINNPRNAVLYIKNNFLFKECVAFSKISKKFDFAETESEMRATIPCIVELLTFFQYLHTMDWNIFSRTIPLTYKVDITSISADDKSLIEQEALQLVKKDSVLFTWYIKSREDSRSIYERYCKHG